MNVKPVTPVNPVLHVAQSERVFSTINQETNKQAEQGNKQPGADVFRQDAEVLTKIMNKITQLYNRQLHFDVHEETNRVYVKIVDKQTQEVIKQIPPEEMLELSAKIREMVGIMLDEYV